MQRIYLSAAETLSQAWLHQAVLLLVLAILKVYFFSTALLAAISAFGNSAAPICQQMLKLQKHAEEAPQRASELVDVVLEQIWLACTSYIADLVLLAAKVAKAILSFMLDIYLGTLTCLATAFVKGFLEFLTDAIEDITKVVQAAVQGVADALNSALSGLSSVVNTVVSAVEAIESLFSSDDSSELTTAFDSMNLTISALDNITIPTSYLSTLESLADSIPDFDEVLSNLTDLITDPIIDVIELAVSDDDTTLANMSIPDSSANSTLTLVDLCDEFSAHIEEAAKIIKSWSTCCIVGLAVGTVLVLVSVSTLSFLRTRRRAQLLAKLANEGDTTEVGNILTQHGFGVMGFFLADSHPEIRWLVSFTCTENLLKCLSIGLIAILVITLQSLILNLTQKALSLLSDSALLLGTNSQLVKEFSTYLGSAQASLNLLMESVNESLFSSIHNTSSEVLSMVEEFQTGLNDTITAVFGSSFLAAPFRTVVYCTIGRKIETIEEGLAWLVDNTYFAPPIINQTYLTDTFQSSLTSLTYQSSVRNSLALGLQTVLKTQHQAQKNELLIAMAFISVWGFYLLVGIMLITLRKIRYKSHGDVTFKKDILPGYTMRDTLPGYAFHDGLSFFRSKKHK